MERNQFTFYASFYKAISRIRSKAARADAYDIICAYALTGKEPDMDKLTDAAAIAFDLIKPNLDASKRKAESGSKPKTNRKQSPNKEEGEGEVENETQKENENEIENQCSPEAGESGFAQFWSVYPKQVGKQKARAAFAGVKEPLSVLLEAVAKQKHSAQWCKDGGRYIPNPETWLRQRRWEDELPVAGGGCYGAFGFLGETEKENIRRLMAEEGGGTDDGRGSPAKGGGEDFKETQWLCGYGGAGKAESPGYEACHIDPEGHPGADPGGAYL